jgi:hypothetical protein
MGAKPKYRVYVDHEDFVANLDEWTPIVQNCLVLTGDEVAYYMALKKNVQEVKQADDADELKYTGMFEVEQELIETAFLLTTGKTRDDA